MRNPDHCDIVARMQNRIDWSRRQQITSSDDCKTPFKILSSKNFAEVRPSESTPPGKVSRKALSEVGYFARNILLSEVWKSEFSLGLSSPIAFWTKE